MTQKLRCAHLHDDLSFKIGARAVAKILVRRPAETIGAAMDAASIAIDRVVECHVRAVIVADDRARFSLFKYFDLGGRRFADPFDRVRQPGIWRIFDVAHACNPVLSMRQDGSRSGRILRVEGVSEPRAVATGLGTQSSRLPSRLSMAPHKQSGRRRTQRPLAVLKLRSLRFISDAIVAARPTSEPVADSLPE